MHLTTSGSRAFVARWLQKTTAFSLCATAALLTGCGGGAVDAPAPPTPSTSANANLLFSKVVVTSADQVTTYEAASTTIDYGARAHLTDVGIAPGQTGKGVWIDVIDDFRSTTEISTTLPLIRRTITALSTTEGFGAAYDVAYQLKTPLIHGVLVAGIAGGRGTDVATSFITTLLPINIAGSDQVACTHSYEAKTLVCPTSFSAGAPLSTLNATLTHAPIPGVASEATMLQSHVDLTASQDALQTVADIQGHITNAANSSLIDVINLSLGSEIAPITGTTTAEVIATLQKFPLPNKINAVITVAAGNSSQPCGIVLNGCNALAVAMISQVETVDSTLVVGALSGSGSAQKIADYSTRAGQLADHFILAPGETGFYNHAVGTSFAAPRVAGVAAIIKQQYPHLTSANIKQIILLSANKDINNDGLPDFVGVDSIFGHGKLSLKNALALAATY